MTRGEAMYQLDLCKSIIYASGRDWLDERDIPVLDMAIEALQERKTGKWTIEDVHSATYKYCCSECKAHHRARYDFCPTCGAKMLEEGGEEDD